MLQEAKKLHKRDWQKKPTKGGDYDQSLRAFKGKNLEKLIEYIIKSEIEAMGLMVVNGNKLERSSKLSDILTSVKKNLEIDYSSFGKHLPDVDLVIYKPGSGKVIAVISSKVILRERVAQTGYWKLKMLQNEKTEHIKVFFVTLDEDGTLTIKAPSKKGRAIAERDFDGTYVLTEEKLEESNKVKLFEHFIADLKKIPT